MEGLPTAAISRKWATMTQRMLQWSHDGTLENLREVCLLPTLERSPCGLSQTPKAWAQQAAPGPAPQRTEGQDAAAGPPMALPLILKFVGFPAGVQVTAQGLRELEAEAMQDQLNLRHVLDDGYELATV